MIGQLDHLTSCRIEQHEDANLLTLLSSDAMNRLQLAAVCRLREAICDLAGQRPALPLIITGNQKFFSAGADLNEIRELGPTEAVRFSRSGQEFTNALDGFPALTIAALSGYCMGGALDLALACDLRIAAPNAVFGHRGAALGILTGWGGTQRLPRLIGKARALQMFLSAEMVSAEEALRIGLVNEIVEEPLSRALQKPKGKMQKAKGGS
jgi:enoyl-CoA hydratase/carnithine racemase